MVNKEINLSGSITYLCPCGCSSLWRKDGILYCQYYKCKRKFVDPSFKTIEIEWELGELIETLLDEQERRKERIEDKEKFFYKKKKSLYMNIVVTNVIIVINVGRIDR